MAGSFIENVNLLASKVAVVEEANSIFYEGVMPILEEIALLDLDEAILDLKKGNYLGNRKIDINLALNMQGITQELIDKHPEQAEAIWTNPSNTVLYNKATATFVDGTIIELPFLFDGNPVTISTHGDLLAQLTRLDYVHAQAQIVSLYQVTVGDYTNYTISIDSKPYTYTSGFNATRESIIAGIANMINVEAIPITARVTDFGAKLTLTADIEGNPFYAEVSPNMAIATIRSNRIEGHKETEFLAKLTGTLAANFASPVVGELVKLYDIIGQNSNLESLRLHAVSGSYIEEAPLYYWAKTTSAFQTLSMRANDIIKLGNEIDNIIKLASSIDEVIDVQNHLPQLIDTYDINGNPNGEQTIYNALTELIELHTKLSELIVVYNDMKVGGNNYIQSIANDLQTEDNIGTVAQDLNLGIDSSVNRTGSNINAVMTVSTSITSVRDVSDNITSVNEVANYIVPNLPEILQADENASIASTKAEEAYNSALLASQKNSEIKNVSVGSTITGAPGTNASVIYNPATGKFTFVVPQGIKGDRGEAFQVNAVGLFASRDLYDSMTQGFSFLAIDTSTIYFKISNTEGDWSLGTQFGKGDQGNKGDTGTSITQISFTSTNHISGLPAQSGGEDLYTIDYSDGSSDSFAVYNGLDSDFSSTSVATITNKVIDSETNTIGANHVHFRVRNLTANPILKGTVVKASAIQSGIDFINVEPTSSTEDRGLGIVSKTIGSNQEGLIINTGSTLGINTSMWEVGKVLYTSINGTLTDVKPKGTLYQPSAYVRRSHSTLGELSVEFSEPRENKDGNLNTNSVVMAIVFGS